jgi:hypothetical protein
LVEQYRGGKIMCFLAVLRLAKMIDEELFAKILKSLGYIVEVRDFGGRKVVEARKGESFLRSYVDRDRVEIKSNDYGPQCLKDLEEIYKAMYEEDLKPEAIEVVSPYIYAREKKRRKTKRFLEELGIEAEEVYSGYCG